jgi:YbbR domain-containing protein
MRKFLRSNNFALVLSVLLAIVLWLFVTGDKITRTTPAIKVWQDVPIRVENLNQDFVITDMRTTVDITLEGLPDAFEELPIQELDAFVDLAGKEAGTHLVRVQGRPPRGLNLVLIEPEQVRIVIEAYYSKDFEIELEFIGEPAPGWELTNYTLLPETVLVGAEESLFENVSLVKLIIDLSGMSLFESVELAPLAYDEEGNPVIGVAIEPNLVTVRLEFERLVDPEASGELNSRLIGRHPT